MNNDLPIYQLVIGDSEIEGVFANALVHDPANESAFVAFSKESPVEVKLSTDKMKRNVTGALLIPDKYIYRRDKERGEYRVFFTREDIEKIVQRFSKNLLFSSVNLEHSVPVEDVHIVESWIAGSIDKSTELGITVPPGTWIATMHIESDDVWNKVIDGTYRGFSIEGMFGLKPVAMSEAKVEEVSEEEVSEEEKINAFIDKMKDASISEEEKLAIVKDAISGKN